MNFLTFLRYIKGFVVIRVYNGFTERFVNLCARKRINIWDVQYDSDGITAKLYAREFIKLKSIKRKSGVHIDIVEKQGLIFFFRKHKNRKILLAGTVMSIFLMLFMNMFVWNIEVSGTYSVSKEEILETTESLGLKIGTFTPLFDETEAGRKAINQFNGKILWMSINLKGSKATVEVRDNNKTENQKNEENSPCNFVADFDGVLESTHTFSGEQKAYTGNAVSKGTILISGIFENEDGSVNYIHSDGIFTAKSRRTLKKSFSADKPAVTFNEKKPYWFLYFFGTNIPLNLTSFLQQGASFSYSKLLSFNNNALPLGIKKTVFYEETERKNIPVFFLMHLDSFTCDEYSELKNTKILNAEYNTQNKNNGCKIEADYDCIDFIGKKSPIKTTS